MEAKASAECAVAASPIEIERAGLRGVHADIEGDALVLADARRRGIALDLADGVVCRLCPDLPGGRACFLILRDYRVGRRGGQCRPGPCGGEDADGEGKRNKTSGEQPHVLSLETVGRRGE